MEMPDNSKCYCYTIMPGLCLPCQVKIHLLHTGLSPHDEEVRNTKPAPTDRTQGSPCSDRPNAQTLASGQNRGKPECDRCNYYANFITQLTSGLCEETIMNVIYGNACPLSSNLRNSVGGRTGQNEPPPTLKEDNVQDPSKVSSKRSKSPDVSDQPAKEKSDIATSKKPLTPENIMTTDKMLKQNFDSIAKKRPLSPISSRSTSPGKKNQSSPNSSRASSPQKRIPESKPKSANRQKSDHKLAKSSTSQKNHSKPAKNEKNITFQKSSRHSGSSKAQKNAGKKRQKKDGKANNSSERKNAKSDRVSLVSPEPVGEALDPGPGTVLCTKEVCEFQLGRSIQRENKAEMGKIEGRLEGNEEKEPPTGMGKIKVDTKNTDGLFEAALVMEFYQPAQQGDRSIGSKAKQPRTGQENEPFSPDFGRDIVMQKRNRNSQSIDKALCEVNDWDEHSKIPKFREEKGASIQISTKEPSSRLRSAKSTIPSEYIEQCRIDNDRPSLSNKPPKPNCTCHLAITCLRHPTATGEEKRKYRQQDVRSENKYEGRQFAEVQTVLEENVHSKVTATDISLREGDECGEVPQTFKRTTFDESRPEEKVFPYPRFEKMAKEEDTSTTDQCENTVQFTTERSHQSQMITGKVRESTAKEMAESKYEKFDDNGLSKSRQRGRLSEDGHEKPIRAGVIKKIREEIEDELRRSYSPASLRQDKSTSPSPGRGTDRSNGERTGQTGSAQKAKSPERQQASLSRTSLNATSVYTTFSEYRNPDREGYKSKSTGNIANYSDREIPPVKSSSAKDPSRWSILYPEDEELYLCYEPNQKDTTIIIRAKPRYREGARKEAEQETAIRKEDNTMQKTNRRDSGTQCDYDPPGTQNPSAAKSGKRIPQKSMTKPSQAADPLASRSKPIPHQQKYFNRTLKRRSFQ